MQISYQKFISVDCNLSQKVVMCAALNGLYVTICSNLHVLVIYLLAICEQVVM